MSCHRILLLILTIDFLVTLQLSYKIDVQDMKVYEIQSDDADYDEESENEMIKPKDLVKFASSNDDESRYKPLHSYVEDYNRREAERKMQLQSVLSYVKPMIWENSHLERKSEPFVAGFKEDLNKIVERRKSHPSREKRNALRDTNLYSYHNQLKTKAYITSTKHKLRQRIVHDTIGKNQRSLKSVKSTLIDTEVLRMRRDDDTNPFYKSTTRNVGFFRLMKPQDLPIDKENENTFDSRKKYLKNLKVTTEGADEYEDQSFSSGDVSNKKTSDDYIENEAIGEEPYDYEAFKREYDEQIAKDINNNKTVNYTDSEKTEESPREVLKELLDYKSKNCSKESKRFEIKTVECLVSGYQHIKDKDTVKKTLSKIWLIFKVWLLIYVCIAIPCWCQRGWCCCCFRCKSCFPRSRILIVKDYYAANPPGTWVSQLQKVKESEKLINYEPTEFEEDAYEKLGTAIRSI